MRAPSASRPTPRTWKWSAPLELAGGLGRSASSVGPAAVAAPGGTPARRSPGAGAVRARRGGGPGQSLAAAVWRRAEARPGAAARRGSRPRGAALRRSTSSVSARRRTTRRSGVGVGGEGGAELVQAPDPVDVGDGAGLLGVQHEIGAPRRGHRSARHRERAAHAQPARTAAGSMRRTASASSPHRLPMGKPNGGGGTPGSQRQVPLATGERPPDQPGAVLLQVLEARRRVEQPQLDERPQDVAVEGRRELPGVGGLLGPEEAAPRPGTGPGRPSRGFERRARRRRAGR